jgi:hypothetical protein
MNYLKEARNLLEAGHETIDRTGKPDESAYLASIAAALIAIAEQLEAMNAANGIGEWAPAAPKAQEHTASVGIPIPFDIPF